MNASNKQEIDCVDETPALSGKWTEEDTNNCDNMFLVETNDCETIFIFVKRAIIHEKDCVTGDLLRSHDLNNLDCAQLLDDEEPRLKLSFKSDLYANEINEVYYTFGDEESLSQFKDQFVVPFINEGYIGHEVKSTSQSSILEKKSESRSTGFGLSNISINFFGTQISIPLRSKKNDGSIRSSGSSDESNSRGASWTDKDVDILEDMFLVENKEDDMVFLFVKDGIIHEKDCVSGDIKNNYDLGVIANAFYHSPGNGSSKLEMRLSFDSRIQSKKEARYRFENNESFNSFKQKFIIPSLVQRSKELSQKQKRFECLKCGFNEKAGQASRIESDKCPQCSSVFIFFNCDYQS